MSTFGKGHFCAQHRLAGPGYVHSSLYGERLLRHFLEILTASRRSAPVLAKALTRFKTQLHVTNVAETKLSGIIQVECKQNSLHPL